MTTPTTKAGRALLEYLDVAARETYMPFDGIRPLILAIEQESRAAEAEALSSEVARLTMERDSETDVAVMWAGEAEALRAERDRLREALGALLDSPLYVNSLSTAPGGSSFQLVVMERTLDQARAALATPAPAAPAERRCAVAVHHESNAGQWVSPCGQPKDDPVHGSAGPDWYDHPFAEDAEPDPTALLG